MIDIEAVIARLKDAGAPRVEGVTSLARIAEKPPQFLPATYVAPDSERGEAPGRVASQNSGIFDQTIASRFSVVLIVGGEAASADAVDRQLAAEAGKIETALAGWVHPGAEGRATEVDTARLLSVGGGTTAWAMSFRTYRRIRKTTS